MTQFKHVSNTRQKFLRGKRNVCPLCGQSRKVWKPYSTRPKIFRCDECKVDWVRN